MSQSTTPMISLSGSSRANLLASGSLIAFPEAIIADRFDCPGAITEMAVTMNSSVPALNSATVQLVINGVDATNGAVSVPALTGAGAKLTASPTGAELHDGDVFGVRVSAASGLLLGGLSATTSLKLSRR